MSVPVQRGDVFVANLNPPQGSEQAGTRPVVIVSRDAINKNSPVVVVVPFTDAENKTRIYPSQVPVQAGCGGLTIDSIAVCEQIRAISKNRLTTALGKLGRAEIAKIDAALKITLDLP